MTKFSWRLLLALCLLLPARATFTEPAAEPPAHEHTVLAASPVSGDSIYNVHAALETSDGTVVALDAFRGRALLVTMFYARCTSVCPLTTLALQRIDLALTDAERAKLQVLMISLDPENDTPTALKTFADEHHLDTARWTVARTEDKSVRLLAAALGIKYRKLPDGTFNHSVVISILDGAGVIVSRSSMLSALDTDFANAVRKAIATDRSLSPK